MKKIFLGIAIVFSCQSLFAGAGDDAKTYMAGKPNREEYARNTASATDATLRKIRNGSVNKSVQAQINNSSTVSDGSKVSGGGSVTKPADAKATASTMAKRLEKAKAFGKASLPSFVGSAALTALVHGVGWVIDEGGNVQKIIPPADTTPDPLAPVYFSSQSGYAIACDGRGIKIYSKSSAVSRAAACYAKSKEGSYTVTQSQYLLWIEFKDKNNQIDGAGYAITPNPIYNPNSPVPAPSYTPVSNSDLENQINNYITNNDNSITNNIINNAYTYDSSNGASISDDTNKLAVENYNDIADAVNHASTAPYNANNPKKGYYMITDGEKTVEGWVDASPSTGSSTSDTTSTTTNPDGSTSTETGSSTSDFTLPAFCDWASVVCDWIGWTKEKPELEDESLKIDEQNPLAFEHVDHVTFGKTCPFVKETVALPMGVLGNMSFEKDLTFICDWGLDAKPFIISAGSLGALIFLLYGIRNGNV